jgi:hypothetical protein
MAVDGSHRRANWRSVSGRLRRLDGRTVSPARDPARPTRDAVACQRDPGGSRRHEPDGPERGISVLENLAPATKNNVIAHEFGHAIDDLAGDIDTEPLMGELRRVYNTLSSDMKMQQSESAKDKTDG